MADKIHMNDDSVNPTGLSKEEVELLQNANKEFMKSPDLVAEIFLAYMKIYPEHQKFFPFKDVPLNELGDNVMFKAHCIVVLYALVYLVDNITRPEILIGLLKRLGLKHSGKSVPPEALAVAQRMILDRISLEVSKEVHTAYTKFWNFSIKVLMDSMNKKYNENVS